MILGWNSPSPLLKLATMRFITLSLERAVVQKSMLELSTVQPATKPTWHVWYIVKDPITSLLRILSHKITSMRTHVAYTHSVVWLGCSFTDTSESVDGSSRASAIFKSPLNTRRSICDSFKRWFTTWTSDKSLPYKFFTPLFGLEQSGLAIEIATSIQSSPCVCQRLSQSSSWTSHRLQRCKWNVTHSFNMFQLYPHTTNRDTPARIQWTYVSSP